RTGGGRATPIWGERCMTISGCPVTAATWSLPAASPSTYGSFPRTTSSASAMRCSMASPPPCRLGAARSATTTSSCCGLTCVAGAEHRPRVPRDHRIVRRLPLVGLVLPRLRGLCRHTNRNSSDRPLVAPTLVRTDGRGRESRCRPLKFATMCWGPDIEAVHRVNQDRLRALAQQMWNRGANSMCDYSLMHVKSRPASVGDKLRTSNFGTGTRGFAAPSDPGTAVCVLPGTELAFNSEIAVYG